MKSPTIVIADFNSENYFPLHLTRPLWTLRWGCFEQRERFLRLKPASSEIFFYTDFLGSCSAEYDSVITAFPDDVNLLIINSMMTVIPSENCYSADESAVYYYNNIPAFIYIAHNDSSEYRTLKINDIFHKLPKRETKYHVPGFLYELPLMNGKIIKSDFSFFNTADNPSIAVSGDRNLLYCHNSAVIEPFVSISTEKGPVIIDEHAHISSFTRIEGPAYIGAHTSLYRANIREGSSFGAHCRIGGEVEDSIFSSYSNKYHDGFIGHSYIGSWVNLGAMTTNSDLRNDYGNVTYEFSGNVYATNINKSGVLMGDFVKTSIGTLINTATVISPCSMTVFSGRMTPQYIPPFSVFIKNKLRGINSIDSFLKTASSQMNRRGIHMEASTEKTLRSLYDEHVLQNTRIYDEWNKKPN